MKSSYINLVIAVGLAAMTMYNIATGDYIYAIADALLALGNMYFAIKNN